MAQPNVAREPSMEEILASIRRIIESNDPASDAAGLHVASETYADDRDEDEAVGFTPELVANDPGLPPQMERRFAAEPVSGRPEPDLTAAPAERSLSLADVAARVRAASARHQDMAMQRPVARMDEPSSVDLRQPEPVASSYKEPSYKEPAYSEPAYAAPLAALPMQELRPSFAGSEESPRSASVVENAAMHKDESPKMEVGKADAVEPQPLVTQPLSIQPLSTQPLAAQPVAVDPFPGTHTSVKTEQPSSLDAFAGLISDAAGAQVAKSFGELADVFDGLDRRSVEDMAQDMLRPMLQEWLDDNLPTLVERLVREEIERVARGPRR